MNLFCALLLIWAFIAVSFQNETDYDPKKAFEMLRASSTSYCTEVELKNMDCGAVCKDLKGYLYLLQNVRQIGKDELVSYTLLVNPITKRFIASFRGSTGTQQMLDKIVNAGYTKYDLNKIDGAVATKYFYDNYKSFLRDSFLNDIRKYIAIYSDFQFYFVGHSFGGAFATLVVLDISLGGLLSKKQINIYNYGCPRVGNSHFVKAVQQNVAGDLFRIVHYKDLVPHVPPCVVNFRSHCVEGNSAKEQKEKASLYYAWHLAPEIFYDIEDSTTFMYCSKNEEMNCSNQFHIHETTLTDHFNYLGVSTGCGGKIAFIDQALEVTF